MSSSSNSSCSATAQSGLQQAVFLYKKTYCFLSPRRGWVEEAQNVLVWNKPFLSASLYITVHLAFVFLVQSAEQSLMTILGRIILWCSVMDILWRAATNQFGEKKTKAVAQPVVTATLRPGATSLPDTPTFESALLRRTVPLKPLELPSLEVISLWIAEGLMWFENLFAALRHWSNTEPYVFSVCVFVPGILLSLLGKYVPSMAILYIIVICGLAWPYMAYHDMWRKFTLHITTYYPHLLEKANLVWTRFKAFASKDKTEFAEVHLDPIEDPSGNSPPPPPAVSEESPGLPSAELHDRAPLPSREVRSPEDAVVPGEDYSPSQDSQSVADSDTSLLQDSVLGLRPNAFLNDSLALDSLMLPGNSGDMPSITDLDQSLTLSQFPRGTSSQESFNYSSINEGGDMRWPARSDSLDPFMDSIEAEFGGYNFTDGGPQPHSRRPPQPRTQLPQMQQINEESPQTNLTGLTGFDTGYGSDLTTSQSSDHTTGAAANYNRGYIPPPTYQSALDGSDGGVSDGHVYSEQQQQQQPVGTSKYWLRQRH